MWAVEAEDDFAHGRRYRALHRVEDHTVKVGRIFYTAQNHARLV